MLVSSSYTGAKLEVMGPQLAEFFGAQGSAGLLVRHVEPNSPAADAGLKAGDVVVKVNSVEVASASDWSKTIHENRGKPISVVIIRERKEQTISLTPDEKKRSSVEPGMDLEEFFGDSEQAEQTRATLAELRPMLDAMSVRMRQRLEEVRATPEMTRMMAKLDAWSNNPEFQRQMEMARRQVQAAADAARANMNSPEFQQKMDALRCQMRDMMRLD
jgi:C-terminal processing protease CtpA/Prc